MASKEEYDRYAIELNNKFEELTRWALTNWPRKNFPLLASDFSESRREIANIIGPKLGDGNDDDGNSGSSKDERESAPFVDVTPMPWP